MSGQTAVIGNDRCGGNCHHDAAKMDPKWTYLMRLSAVAIGAFAAYLSWQLFVPCFAIGAFAGVFLIDGTLKARELQSTCSQSCLEQLTQISLPVQISILFNIIVMIQHMEHHPLVYIPIAGFTLGAWVALSVRQRVTSIRGG